MHRLTERLGRVPTFPHDFASQATRRFATPSIRMMSGTPLSVLDPTGSPTIESTYEKMAANITVRRDGLG